MEMTGIGQGQQPEVTVPVETSNALVVQDNALIVQDGLGYDWSYIAQDEPTEFALMAYTSNSSGSDTELGLESVEAQLVVHQKNEAVYEEKIAVLEFEVKDKSNAITRLKNQLDETLRERDDLKAKLEQFETSFKNLNKLINSQISSKDKIGLGYGDQLNENDSSGLDNSIYRPTANKTSASVSQVETSITPPSNTSVEMSRVESVRPSGVIIEDWVSDDAEDISQSNDLQATEKPSFKKIEFTNARNEFVKPKQAEKPRITTQNPKVDRRDWNAKMAQKLGLGFGSTILTRSGRVPVSTAKKSSLRATSSTSTFRLGNPQQALKNKGIFDSGCSRHMTRNKDFLTDYQDIDGGFVAFGGSARCSLNVDKKNSVLFTKTECLVLSPDFKLLDASQVLLRVPRQSNMYSFDLKNVVPSGDLTCLFAKATIDESKLWHRRLGHVNFKTMNKLVKGNLVRGLPLKIFENDHTCVACQKGKQHKASCKAKLVSSISQPLQMLHMDLFGPTSVRSINHKTYCLVVTDDFSREFSVARTSQQNGVAERKNRTLIEAARTMLADSLLPTVYWLKQLIFYLFMFWIGKFDGKAEEGFLVGYSVNSKAFRVFNSQTRKVEENLHVNFLENKPNVAGQGPNWLFDIDSLINFMNYQPVTAGNQTNKNACLQEANGNTDLKQSVDAGQSEEKNVSTQQYIVFPLWPSISSSYKSSDENDTADDSTGEPLVQKPTSENEQALKNVLDKMMDQEKEASEQSHVVRKVFVSKVYAASAPRTSNDAGPSSVSLGRSFPLNVNDLLDDPLMPDLEDTVEVQNTGIFGSAFDDEDLDTTILLLLI
ncbi:putative ribonuclease H-like domain-containing protein [Tanacetum coccineum]